MTNLVIGVTRVSPYGLFAGTGYTLRPDAVNEPTYRFVAMTTSGEVQVGVIPAALVTAGLSGTRQGMTA